MVFCQVMSGVCVETLMIPLLGPISMVFDGF